MFESKIAIPGSTGEEYVSRIVEGLQRVKQRLSKLPGKGDEELRKVVVESLADKSWQTSPLSRMQAKPRDRQIQLRDDPECLMLCGKESLWYCYSALKPIAENTIERLLAIDHDLRTNVVDPFGQAVINKKPLASEDSERMKKEVQDAVAKTQEAWTDLSTGVISCYERLFKERPLIMAPKN